MSLFDPNYPPDDQPRPVPGLRAISVYDYDTDHKYDCPPSQCWPHRFSTLYDKEPTCLDCGGKKCKTPGCQHLVWDGSQGESCTTHEAAGYVDDLITAAYVNQDAEDAFDSWIWYQAALKGIEPKWGNWRDRRCFIQ